MLALLLLACDLVPKAVTLPADTGWAFQPDPAWTEPERLQVATFNIEWLSDQLDEGFEPRNDVDYRMVGRLLVAHDFELVALQEIDGDTAMQRLELPDSYAWHIGESGWGQHVAIVYKRDVVELGDVREISLPSTTWGGKDPLAARVRWTEGDLSFTFIGLHLKASDDIDSATTRAGQIADLYDHIHTELLADRSTHGPHVVIAGDFNETFTGINSQVDALAPFQEDPRWTFTTTDTLEYTHIGTRSKIDHIVLSDTLVDRYADAGTVDACKVVEHDHLRPWSDYDGGHGDDQNISDHRPVWIYLDQAQGSAINPPATAEASGAPGTDADGAARPLRR